MSAKIIREKMLKKHIEYTYNFDIDNDGGYAFPCTEAGKILMDEIGEEALKNLLWCFSNLDKFICKPYVKKYSWSYYEPALAQCTCGQKFELEDEYMGACQCPKCGAWYNLFGQRLLDPEFWEGEDIDERW